MSTALQSSVQAVAPPSQLRQKLLRAKQELCATVLGYEDEIEMMLLCLVADGNVSALGDPGTGKTLSMKALARVLGGSHYRRVQMVPDLMPADILGTEVWNKETGEFTYMHGPLNPLVNLFHADEINRTPPRTQAALLEAMEEKQFSVPGCTSQTKNTYPLHEVCLVLATRNAIDSVEGTYPLPSAELDRFAVELYFRRLSREKELEVVRKTSFARHSLAATQEGVLNIADIPSIRNEVESTVVCKERAFQYAENIIFATRPEGCPASLRKVFSKGVSVRAAQWALRLARVRAYMNGGTYVDPADIKHAMNFTLPHRLCIDEEKLYKGLTVQSVIAQLLSEVKIPTEI